MTAHNSAARRTPPQILSPPQVAVPMPARVVTGLGARNLSPPHTSNRNTAAGAHTSPSLAAPPSAEQKALFDRIDVNGDGVIDRNEFIAAFQKVPNCTPALLWIMSSFLWETVIYSR